MSFPLVGNLSENPEGLRIPNAFGTMTKSDKNVALLMTVLVSVALKAETSASSSQKAKAYSGFPVISIRKLSGIPMPDYFGQQRFAT